jgi:hypothetical protein
MTPINRRTFLRNAGLLGASAVLADGMVRPARADKPVNFSGWVFKPDTVADYVKFYNQKYNAQVKYEAIPWAQYHPTMETRALAARSSDVMYCNHNNRERWYENGLIRPVDDLPGVDELKKKMTPANLDSMKSKDGTKLLGLPYFTSLFILIYNEPMLQQAGIKAPAKSWDELVEHCTKLKRDKVSDTPFLPNWNNSPSGVMPQFMTDCFSEGAERLRRQEPGHRRPGAGRGQGHGALAEGVQGRPGEPRGADQDVVDGHAPALLDRALRLPHQPLLLPEDHRRGARELEARPQEGEDGDVPRHRQHVHVDRLLYRERQDQGPRGRVEAHALSSVETSTATGTCSGNGA